MTLRYERMASPIGELGIVADEAGRLVQIAFLWQRGDPVLEEAQEVAAGDPRTAPAIAQLAEYFAGRRRVFDLELAPRGTAFQQTVWRALCEIPFGERRTYSEIAADLERPGAARAVGRANATNPIPIVVPCHRVVGADGTLTGYAGGLDVKRRLLQLEGGGESRSGQLALGFDSVG